jgi:hypothetical protein
MAIHELAELTWEDARALDRARTVVAALEPESSR